MGEKLYLTEAGEVDVDVLNHARSRHAKQRHVRSTVHGGLFQRALAADQDPLVHEARLAEPVVNAAKKQHDVAVLARVHRLCDRSRVDRGLGVVRPRSIAVAVVVRVERGVLRRAFACASGWREVVSAPDQKTTKLDDKKNSKKKRTEPGFFARASNVYVPPVEPGDASIPRRFQCDLVDQLLERPRLIPAPRRDRLALATRFHRQRVRALERARLRVIR